MCSRASTLLELFQYHGWANERILTACAGLATAELAAPMPDLYGSPLETLTHLVSVEANYLRLMRGQPTYPEHLEEVMAAIEKSRAASDGYLRLIAEVQSDDLERPFRMPGLNRDLSLEQGLIQVATHSTQHRADLASSLTRLGKEPPALDYVQYLLDVSNA